MGSSTVRQKKFGSDHGLIHEAVVTGRKVGADEEFWKALTDEAMFRRVVRLVNGDDVPSGSITPEEAAQIMGNNFHGVVAAETQFGFRLNAKDKRTLLNVPFLAGVLQVCRETHVLVPGLPLSIMDIYGKASHAFNSSRNPWFAESGQEFAHTKVIPGWYLIRRNEVAGSRSKTWSEQKAVLVDPDFVPEANLAAYAYVLHYVATGERIFSKAWVRTNSVAADGNRVNLNGKWDGLRVNRWRHGGYRVHPFGGEDAIHSFWNSGRRSDDIGVASARKSN